MLGLDVVRAGDFSRNGGGKYVLLRDSESGQRLELNWYPKAPEFDQPYSAAEGLDHIGFEVPGSLRPT